MALAPAQFSTSMHLLGNSTGPFNHFNSIKQNKHHLPPTAETPSSQKSTAHKSQHAAVTTATATAAAAAVAASSTAAATTTTPGGRTPRRVTLVHSRSAPVSPTLPATEVAAVVRQKKTVHFCDTLEQVRLFLKTQKPSAVREGDPPSPPLELKFPNWPEKTVLRSNRDSMVRMESVQLESSGPDGIVLSGRCKVANVAFQKHVVVRYTTDYWKTNHEIVALYREPIGASANTWDRFTFEIKLDQPCTLYIVLRYDVNDTEFWDNNDGHNYEVDIVETPVRASTRSRRTSLFPKGFALFKDEQEVEPSSTREPEEALAAPQQQPRQMSQQQVQQKQLPQKEEEQQQRPSSGFAFASANTMFSSPISPSYPKKKLGSRYDFGASLSAAKKYEPSYPFLMLSTAMGGSTPSSPTASDEDIQAQYHDLVNKYCFYGNSSTTTSAEPICG